jgi:hypothetical protein
MIDLYYTPPTDKQFIELKEKAIKIWQTYDNQFGYVDEKVNSIKDIKNIEDNFMFIVAMFDPDNQAKLSSMLSQETRKAVSDRMIAGGAMINPFSNTDWYEQEYSNEGGE